jgi:3-oxoacyl-[acyl-carrier-protein] synthase II
VPKGEKDFYMRLMEPLHITGLGMISALGLGRAAHWEQLLRGVGGIAPVAGLAANSAGANLGAEIKGFNPKDTMSAQFYRRLSRLSRLAVAVSCEALTDSRLQVSDNNRRRLGVIWSTAFGSTHQTDAFFLSLLEQGPQSAEPILFPDTVPNAPASHVAMFQQLQGPNSTFCQNHLSGENALAFAASVLASGQTDALLVGGVDELSAILWHSLNALRVIKPLSQGGPMAPDQMPSGRGFVPGEAATCLVLEPGDRAGARQATTYGMLLALQLGSAQARQGHYPTDDGALADILRAALEDARLRPGDIDILGLAANGVEELEVLEASALQKVFGAGWQQIPRLPLRYSVGEFGSAGLLSMATVLLALHEGVVPPVIIGPYLTGRPGDSERFCPARHTRLRYGMIIGCTFGGGMSCVVVGCGDSA